MRQISSRSWRARALGVLVATALIGGAPGLASPAAAATPGCTVATATPIDVGATTTHATTCSGSSATYSYVDLGAGDLLTFNLDARGLINSYGYLYLYAPGVDDFSIDETGHKYIREASFNKNEMTQVNWRVFETGRFIIMWYRGQGLMFGPSVTAVAPQAGRTSGSCRIESAPTIPVGVTQYSESYPCDTRFWLINLTAGTQLSVPMQSWNYSYIDIYAPGVNDFTLDATTAWCKGNTSGITTLDCGTVLQSGAYVIAQFHANLSFTPTVITPTPVTPTPTVKYPTVRIWTYSNAKKLEVDVDPNAGFEWKVRLQKLKNNVWVNASKKKTTKSTHRKFNPKKGTYRVVVYAKNGYSTTATTSVWIRK